MLFRSKYYACAEYGELYQRPHYHAIIFNVHNPEFIAKAWRYGNVDVQIRPKSGAFAYTAKYINKDKIIPVDESDDRVPEFSRMSKGIGESYITSDSRRFHKENLLENCYVSTGTEHKQPMPRYYKRKIYTHAELQELAEYAEYLAETEYFDQIDLHNSGKSNMFHTELMKKLYNDAKFKSKNTIKRNKDGTEKIEYSKTSFKQKNY